MATSQMYLEYNDPLRIIWRAGTEDDPYVNKIDTFRIINNRVVLSEIPSKFDKVKIAGYTEVLEDIYRRVKELASNEFYVNYSNGLIQFNRTEEDRSVTCEYKGRGIIQYPAERIYAHNKRKDNVVENLQQIIDDSLNKINEAQIAIDEVNAAKAATQQATAESKVATDNANIARDSATLAAEEARRARDEAYEAADSIIIVYLEPVETFADISTTYPTPINGSRVMVQSTGDIYRYDDVIDHRWELIENYTGGAVPLASRISSGMFSKDDYIMMHDVLEYKSIVFVIPTLQDTGVQKPLIRFPFVGTIESVYAYCNLTGSALDTTISVEKITETNFLSGNAWSVAANMVIPINVQKSTVNNVILGNVAVGDYFRVNLGQLDNNMTGLTIQLDIKL